MKRTFVWINLLIISIVFNSPNKKDVFGLIKGACKESILPTCRLGKNATGLLLFTNDNVIAKNRNSKDKN